MAIDDGDLAIIRQWVGKNPDLETLDEIHTRTGDAYVTSLEVLRARRADFAATPVQIHIDGQWRQNHQYNLDVLDEQIKALEKITGAEDSSDYLGTTVMTRTRLDRR